MFCLRNRQISPGKCCLDKCSSRQLLTYTVLHMAICSPVWFKDVTVLLHTLNTHTHTHTHTRVCLLACFCTWQLCPLTIVWQFSIGQSVIMLSYSISNVWVVFQLCSVIQFEVLMRWPFPMTELLKLYTCNNFTSFSDYSNLLKGCVRVCVCVC